MSKAGFGYLEVHAVSSVCISTAMDDEFQGLVKVPYKAEIFGAP